MSVPEETTVLVIGGGPSGSYAASALAREGVDVVLLEADIFPRYHIGESMLASIRHFLRFIDLDSTFDNHGFKKKIGAAFKLNDKRTAYTDFIAAGGKDNYGWNVIRSEADELMFRHAGKSGAKIFDGTKVNTIEFVPLEGEQATTDFKCEVPGRPVSATWSRKDGSSGVIKFEYIIDASGRAGVISTKYMKNRKYNQGLKNVANWGYWKGATQYAVGTAREGVPFFQALTDTSGWCWFIPLHNGTVSVGIVTNQEMSTARKRAMGSPSTREFYVESVKMVPEIQALLDGAELVSDIKAASDWSYSASSYASPNVRISGDAGCFIDPFFSSGVHLALTGGLSAALTICAARNGTCSEATAANWHTSKVSESYTRFLLIVLSALKQIRQSEDAVLSDFDEDGFEKAFAHFRPIIQGTADVHGKVTQDEVTKTMDFCLNAFQETSPQEGEALLKKVEEMEANQVKGAKFELTDQEQAALKTIRARQMLRKEDILHIDNFVADPLDGFVPVVQRGNLGLAKVVPKSVPVAERVPVSEPMPVAEPTTVPEPVTVAEPVLAPEPVTVAEPVLAPEPVTVAEPILIPGPAPVEEPVLVSEPAPVPEPTVVAEPMPVPELVTVAEPVPALEPVSVPEAMVVAEPVLVPEPVAAVEPIVVPEPVNVVEPVQVMEPISVAEPVPIEEPKPVAESVAVVEPMPVVESKPIEESTPFTESKPIEEPVPVLEPLPFMECKPVEESMPVLEPLPVMESKSVEEHVAVPESMAVAEPMLIAKPAPVVDSDVMQERPSMMHKALMWLAIKAN